MADQQLENLDLNLLLSLHWLLTERNVTEAAKRMNLSQPATSRALSRLREVFDDPLLIKSGRIMTPTKKAEKLQPSVSIAVERMRDVLRVSKVFQPENETGRVRIACKDNVSVSVAIAWNNTIAKKAPGLELDLVDLTFAAARDLISGQIDLVVMPDIALKNAPPGMDLEQFVQKPILKDPFLSAIRKGHPLANQELTLEQFVKMEHILINPSGDKTGMVDTALDELGLSRRIKYRNSSFLAGLFLLSQTDCILTAPASVFQVDMDGLMIIEPPLKLPESTLLAGWHPNWTHDTRHKWIRDQIFTELSK